MAPRAGQVGGCPDPTTADSPRLGLLPGAAGTIDGGGPPESTKDGATVYFVDLDGSSLKAIDKGALWRR